MKSSLSVCAMLVAGLAFGCGPSRSGNSPASGTVKSQVVSSSGGTVSVAASDNKDLAGTSIAIPSGALSANTTITIAPGSGSVAQANQTAAGPVVQFGPDGTTFAEPATITLPYALPQGASAESLQVAGKESNGTAFLVDHGQVTVDASASTLSFQVTHFTEYGAVVASGTSAGDGGTGTGQTCQWGGAQCPSGLTCDQPSSGSPGTCVMTCQESTACPSGMNCCLTCGWTGTNGQPVGICK